jgi:hypothetical protein
VRLAILAVLCLLCCPVLAEDSYAIVEYPEPDPVQNIPYVYQGDIVYINDTVDISGVAPPYDSLAYWDGFDMYSSVPSYNITLPDNKKGYYKFWLDPSIFGGREGWWYKYDGWFEQQGNNRAFYVAAEDKRPQINQSNYSQTNYTPHVVTPAPLLPERHITDYVVARGDEVTLPDGEFRFWVFGRVNGVYFNDSNVISKEQTLVMEPGNYKIFLQYPGNNTIYDYGCTGTCGSLEPAFYGNKPVDTTGYSPYVMQVKLRELLAGTDDTFAEYTMELDDPYITIHQADEKEYHNMQVLEVRGYSNVAANTSINVSLDEKDAYYKDVVKRYSFTTAARSSLGNLSYYMVNVPINYAEIAADARNHTLTARTALGGITQKNFKISIMPADSYRPNATLKYIDNRVPDPTPTPERITVVQTVTVIRTVTVPVTPRDDVVYEQQKIAQRDIMEEWAVFGFMGVVALMIAIGIVWYGCRVYRRL